MPPRTGQDFARAEGALDAPPDADPLTRLYARHADTNGRAVFAVRYAEAPLAEADALAGRCRHLTFVKCVSCQQVVAVDAADPLFSPVAVHFAARSADYIDTPSWFATHTIRCPQAVYTLNASCGHP